MLKIGYKTVTALINKNTCKVFDLTNDGVVYSEMSMCFLLKIRIYRYRTMLIYAGAVKTDENKYVFMNEEEAEKVVMMLNLIS